MYNFELTDPSFLPHAGCELALTLKAGQLLLLVGENGIGKSTLVRRIYKRFETNASLIEQRSLDFFYDRKVSVIKTLLLSHLNAEEQNLFKNIWSLFRLDLREDRLLSALSGGEGQMLKICIGLSIGKDIYLLDEPSQYLDTQTKEALCEITSGLLNKGKAILVIEHDKDWIHFSHETLRLRMDERTLKVGV